MILLISTEDNNRFSLAIGDKVKIAKIKTVERPFHQSEMLLSEIKKIVGKNKIAGLMAVSGPGAFSGLRIGVATANALAYAWKAPIVGVKVKDSWLNEKADDRIEKIWLAGVKQLARIKKSRFVMPEYGREPNINGKGK